MPDISSIAITGARGTVGQEVVRLCASKGYRTIQINRSEGGKVEVSNTEERIADIAGNYEETLNAVKRSDAIIHLAAIPNPVDKQDANVHNNNVDSAFNGFRAAAELGIKTISYASSVNAIGLAYANQPLHFDYFPLDEEAASKPTDSYALAKQEAELQARSFVEWFPGTKIACLRIHEVAPRADVRKEHQDDWEGAGVKQLWGWVHPAATARACLLAIEKADNFQGCEDIPSRELAQRHYPNARIKGNWGKSNEPFWTIGKTEKVLGWRHDETAQSIWRNHPTSSELASWGCSLSESDNFPREYSVNILNPINNGRLQHRLGVGGLGFFTRQLSHPRHTPRQPAVSLAHPHLPIPQSPVQGAPHFPTCRTQRERENESTYLGMPNPLLYPIWLMCREIEARLINQEPQTAVCQLPATVRASEDRYRSENDTSERSQPKFLLLDTPGHGKLRHHAVSSVTSSKALRGILFFVDSAAVSSAAGLTETAEYLHDILLALQKRNAQGKTSKRPEQVPVLVAANKQDVFTSLPAGIVRSKLQEEITKVRQTKSKGLLDSGMGMDDDEMVDEEANWLGAYGSKDFKFEQMEEHGVDIQIVGGNVKGDGKEKGKVEDWWAWVGDNL
ncbi:hypothetical protein D0867_14939 [Hortaea werneckii]|uniref:Signal recognition particle receptor subunit beta n=1 Tax=Hortaea werneckii TaxID=91943 RepID=A0A3M6XL11_HORWE|nr:hypothetical protein D0867_14939 [Hortaea werneckii]